MGSGQYVLKCPWETKFYEVHNENAMREDRWPNNQWVKSCAAPSLHERPEARGQAWRHWL